MGEETGGRGGRDRGRGGEVMGEERGEEESVFGLHLYVWIDIMWEMVKEGRLYIWFLKSDAQFRIWGGDG